MDTEKSKGKTYRYKIALIGNEGTGKTSIIERYMEDKFESDYRPTLGTNIMSKTFHLSGVSAPNSHDQVILTIWDLAGQDRYEPMRHSYFQGSSGIIMVYDRTRIPTFTAITEKWINDCKRYAESDPVVILVGNKSDLVEQIKIDGIQGLNAAKHIRAAQFIETSAKNGENISFLFDIIITQLLKKHKLLDNNTKNFTFE